MVIILTINFTFISERTHSVHFWFFSCEPPIELTHLSSFSSWGHFAYMQWLWVCYKTWYFKLFPPLWTQQRIQLPVCNQYSPLVNYTISIFLWEFLSIIKTVANYYELICINNRTARHVGIQCKNVGLSRYPCVGSQISLVMSSSDYSAIMASSQLFYFSKTHSPMPTANVYISQSAMFITM